VTDADHDLADIAYVCNRLEVLAAFADGDERPELLAWLRMSVARWLRRGGALHAELGVPMRGERAAVALRDLWLRRAAAARPAGRTTQRATWIVVQSRRLAVWRTLAAPPSTATEAEWALWRAMRYAPIPKSVRQVSRIIGALDTIARSVSRKLA
jgi:hypothetical protein